MKCAQVLTFGILTISSALLSHVAFADELRCNGTMVKFGMGMEEVQSLCGEPAAINSSQEVLREVSKDQTEKDTFKNIESWLFDVEAGSNMRVVEFAEGRVRHIGSVNQRGSDPTARAENCAKLKEKISVGINAVLIKYFCGTPMQQVVLSDEFRPGSKLSSANTSTSKRVRTEQWNYRLEGRELRVTISNGVIQGVTSF